MSKSVIAVRSAPVPCPTMPMSRSATWRRLALGTALASGVLVVNVVTVDTARAQVTTDTTGPAATDRRPDSDIGFVNRNVAITGFGFAPQNTTAGNMTVTTFGIVTVDAGNTPTVGGNAAVSITAAGGVLEYNNFGGVQNLGTGIGVELKQNGAGSVFLISTGAGISSATDVGVRITSNTAGAGNITSKTAGITAGGLAGIEVTSAGTASNIGITTSGLVEVAKTGGKGISATLTDAAAAGTITVTANGATQATGVNSNGIFVSQAGSGLVTVTAKGGIASKGTAGTLDTGINVQLAGTSTAGSQINVTGDIGAVGDVLTGNGVNLAINNAANASNHQVTINNASVFSTANAINVIQQGTGNVTVTGTGTGTISSNPSNGIFVRNQSGGAGNLTVDVTQAVEGKIAGIQATTNGTGNIDIKAGGNVTGNGGGAGILVSNTNAAANAGTISVSLAAGKTLTAGGIGISVDAGKITGATAVTADGAVTGATQGIKIIHNGTGGITVGGTGDIKGSGGAGIDVLSTGKLLAGSDILINGSGSVTGTGARGIDARIFNGASAGDIIIQQSGAVSGDQAISAFNAGLGKSQVVTTGAVTATGTTGIAAQTATGDALVTVGAGGVVNSGGAGVTFATNGGNIKLDGTGNIETTKATDNAIRALSVGTTGAITISGSGNTTAVDATAVDLQQTNAANKGAILFDRTGTVSGGNGIVASHAGTDAAATLTVQTTGAVTATTGIGIQTTTVGGLNTVTVGAGGVSTKSGTFGVSATSTGVGNVLVNGTGVVAGGSTAAISAVSSATGTGSVTVSGGVGVNNTAANGSGIVASIANAANTKAILIDTTGNVIFGGGTGTGIDAQTASTGNVTVTPGGSITSAGAANTGTGINAKTTGAGQIVVTTATGTTIGTAGVKLNQGIVTNAEKGSTDITVNGEIIAAGAGSTGIKGTSTSGAITVNVSATGKIDPLIGTDLVTATGALTVNNAGLIEGDNIGVQLKSTGAAPAGTLTIAQTGTGKINGKAQQGVTINSVDANVVITGAGAATVISGGTNGIEIASTGTGNISIADNTVTGGTNGVVASQTGIGTGTDGIKLTGAGTITGTTGQAVDLSINNAGNAGNIVVNRTDDITGKTGGIKAQILAGSGGIDVTAGGNVTVTGAGQAFLVESFGNAVSNSAVKVTTTAGKTITTNAGGGILAQNTAKGTGGITVNSNATLAVSGGNGISAINNNASTGDTVINSNAKIGSGSAGANTLATGILLGLNPGVLGNGTVNLNADIGTAADRGTGDGIRLTNGGIANTGNLATTITGASVFSKGDGIVAVMNGTGNITITGTGAGVIDSSTARGIFAEVINNQAGTITINVTQDVKGATGGILATTNGTGNLKVTAGGNVTTTAGAGISATNTNAAANAANIDVTVAAGKIVNATGGNGVTTNLGKSTGTATVIVNGEIKADAANTGIKQTSVDGNNTITVATTGKIDPLIGIDQSTVNGANLVTNAGFVEGDTISIRQNATGTGTNTVFNKSEGIINGKANEGVLTSTTTGKIVVTNTGKITGGTTGVKATATSGTITVSGAGTITGTATRGIDAATTLVGGTILIDATGAVTGGTDGISAVTAVANNVTVTGTGAVTGNGGAGILASSQGGNVTVTPASTVTGQTAQGIKATTIGAGTVTVTTTGLVTAGTNGVEVTTVDGAATVTVNGVTAAGTAGVTATSTTGAVTITSNGPVTNSGALVNGLTGTSAGNVTITSAGTIGATGTPPTNGIVATTTGAAATAKIANSANVTATALGLSATSPGKLDVTNSASVTAAIAARVAGAGGLGGTVANTGQLTGTTTGVAMASTGVVALSNAGTISGPTAISTTAGTLNVSNSGVISGQITTAGGIANITNSGIWNNVRAGGAATSTVTSLTNTGTINMINGATGDSVAVTGAYTGGGSSTISVDVDLSRAAGAGRADTLTAASGAAATRLTFSAINGGRTSLSQPIDVLTAPGVTVTNLGRIANLSNGLFGYALVQSPTSPGTFQITSVFNSGPVAGVVSGVSGMVTSLQAGFHQPASAIISRPDNCGVNQITGGPFIRMNGGDTRVSNNTSGSASTGGSNFTSATTSRSDFKGVQGGFDFGLCNVNGTGWNIHAGLMGGFVETDSTTRTRSTSAGVTDFTRTSSKVEVPFFGAYGFATSGDFTAELNVRKDWYNAKITSVDEITGLNFVGPQQRLRGTGLNFNGSASYRLWLPANWYVEPSVGLSSGRVSFGSLPLDPTLFGGAGFGMISVSTSKSLLGRVGMNIGAPAVQLTEKFVIVPFAHVALWREFGSASKASALINTGTSTETFTTQTTRVGTFGQVGGGLQFKVLDSPLLGFVRGDVRFGKELQGKSLNAGFRVQF